MTARQLAWRACYELLAARITRPEWAFMNYGYAPLDPSTPLLVLEPADEPDRFCIQLYHHTVGASSLEGKDVLEVGCGRGGGASYIARYLRPRSMTGLDFSTTAIGHCVRYRQAPGLRFVHGDAQSMPFADQSFDAVVNVESSHCYGDMDAFLAEVHRVLRPGGELLWADLRDRGDRLDSLFRQFDSCALALAHDRDVTPEVLHAMRLDNARKLALIGAWFPRVVHPLIRRFAGLEGTRNYVRMAAGSIQYQSARLLKAAPTPGASHGRTVTAV